MLARWIIGFMRSLLVLASVTLTAALAACGGSRDSVGARTAV